MRTKVLLNIIYVVFSSEDAACIIDYTTRATFETSNYPRRPWDRYTAPNSKCIGASPPPPPPQEKKWKTLHSSNRPGWKNWSHCETVYSDLKTSPTVKSFACGCFVDTVRLPCAFRFAPMAWFSRISSSVANRYRKSTSLLKRSVSITSIS